MGTSMYASRSETEPSEKQLDRLLLLEKERWSSKLLSRSQIKASMNQLKLNAFYATATKMPLSPIGDGNTQVNPGQKKWGISNETGRHGKKSAHAGI